MVECVGKGVNLTCSPIKNNMFVSWTKNGMKTNATHTFLHVFSSELKSGDHFSCTVSNQISEKSAKEVKPVCSDTGPVYQNHLTYVFSCIGVYENLDS